MKMCGSEWRTYVVAVVDVSVIVGNMLTEHRINDTLGAELTLNRLKHNSININSI